MVDSKKIESFEQLTVWQESQNLAISVYSITKNFPKDELFAMTSQIRRAAYSISANIAEGFGRQTNKDKVHFYSIAYGSLLELKNFLYLAEKLGYLQKQDLEPLIKQGVSCQKLINAFKSGLLHDKAKFQ
jgi:four helix bundle protein